jgi:hypothetical protein
VRYPYSYNALERQDAEEMAAITRRMQSDALRLQQMQARVGSSVVPPPVPHPDTEETSKRPRTISSCRAVTSACARGVRSS